MSSSVHMLFITWQEPESRRIFPVARLLRLPGGGYEWAYVRAVQEARARGFSGLPGFEDIEQVSISPDLPALFEHRLPARGRRGARGGAQAANDSLDPAPITVLVPSGPGRHERLEVFAPPLPAPFGKYWGVFVARGVGRIAGTEDALGELQPHEPLTLLPEPANAYNPRALLIARADGTSIGYVPDYLANELAVAGGAGALQVEMLSAERVSFAPSPPIYSVLCRYTCGAELGQRLFRSAPYEPISGEAFRVE